MTTAVPLISTDEGSLLRHALPPLLAQPDVDVLVVDNACGDDTATVAAEHGVRVLTLEERHHWCAAMNVALGEVGGESVLFMQPDCFLEPGFVEAARRQLDDPSVGSVAPKLIRTEGPHPSLRIDAIDAAGMYVDRFHRNGLVGHGRPALAYATSQEAFGADGAAALYRRSALEDAAVDGQVLDEDFVTWGVDADLAWRLRLLGWRCMYEPRAVAHHVRTFSPSTRRGLPEWDRMMQFRNRLLMIVKNDPLDAIVRDLPALVLQELLLLGYAALLERHLLRGYLGAALLLPRMVRRRRELQERRRRRAAPPAPLGLEPIP